MTEIKYRIKRLLPEQELLVVTDYNAGISIAEIMNRYDISKVTLYRILKRTTQKGGETNEKSEQEENREQVANGGTSPTE